MSQTATEFEKTYTPLITGDTPKDIIFLIDFSKSTAENVDMIKSCLKSLVMKTPFKDDDHRISIIQYADRAVVDQPFSWESGELIATICGMSRRSGNGTATDIGLSFTKNKLLGEGREKSKKVVIVITDGGSNDYNKTKQQANELKGLPSCNVLCLGVGHGVNKKEIDDIASQGMSFVVQSYAEMDKIFSRMILTSQKPILVLGERGTDVIYLRTKADEEIDTTFLEMYDEAKRDWVSVDKARSTNVKKEGLASGTEYQFRAKVKFASGIISCYSDIVKATTFKKEIINKKLTNKADLADGCKTLEANIKDFKLDPLFESNGAQLNILLLGLFGNGKSSLTNLMRSVIGESAIALVGSSSYHVTQEVNAYSSFSGKARIWDIFGWDDELRNFNDGQLIDYIVDGRIEPGAAMKENGQIEIGNQTTILERIHGVIIVVSSEVMTDDEYLGKLEKINKALIKKRYEPIYVLNKMDMIDERLANVNEVGQGISLMYNSPSVLTYKELFVKKTRINPENVHPLVCQLQKNIPQELKYLILNLNWSIIESSNVFFERCKVNLKKKELDLLQPKSNNVPLKQSPKIDVPQLATSIKVKSSKVGIAQKVLLSKYSSMSQLKQYLQKPLKLEDDFCIMKGEIEIIDFSQFEQDQTYVAKEAPKPKPVEVVKSGPQLKVKKLKGGPVTKFNLGEHAEMESLLEEVKKKLKISDETVYLVIKEGDDYVNVAEIEDLDLNQTYSVATEEEANNF